MAYVVEIDGDPNAFNSEQDISGTMLEALAGGRRVVALKEKGKGGVFPLNKATDLYKSPLPRGTFTAIMAAGATAAAAAEPAAPEVVCRVRAIDIRRAEALVNAVRRCETLDQMLAMTAPVSAKLGVLSLTTTQKDAELRCLIAVCTDAVVVALDCSTQTQHILEFTGTTDLPDKAGSCHAGVCSQASAIPVQTLLALCVGEDAQQDTAPSPSRDGASDAGSQSEPVARPNLVLCGDRLSGSVAHAAAFFVREAIANVEVAVEVSVVAFGAPMAFGVDTADSLTRAGGEYHLTICHRSDALLQAALVAMQLASTPPQMRREVASSFVDHVSTLLVGTTEVMQEICGEVKKKFQEAKALASHAVEPRPPSWFPVGVHQFRFSPSDPPMDLNSTEDIKELMCKAEVTGPNLRVHSTLARLPLYDEVLTGESLRPFSLQPVIQGGTLLCTNERFDLTLTGAWLEAAVGRLQQKGCSLTLELDLEQAVSEIGSLYSRRPVAPLIVGSTGLVAATTDAGSQAVVLVRFTSPTELRLIITGVARVDVARTPKVQVLVRTDFGDSAVFELDPQRVKQGEDLAPETLLHNTAGEDFLQTALVRTLICDVSRAAGNPCEKADPRLLRMLIEIEEILLSKREVADQYNAFISQENSIAKAIFCLGNARRTLLQIADNLANKMDIQLMTPARRRLRSLLRGIGRVVGGTLLVIAGAAALPGALLIVPSMLIANRVGLLEENSSGSAGSAAVVGLLGLPGALTLLPSMAIGAAGYYLFQASSRANQDIPTRSYLARLKLLLAMLDADLSLVLEETTSLESVLNERFKALNDNKPLSISTEKDVRAVLTVIRDAKKDEEQHAVHVMFTADGDSQSKILRAFLLAGRFYEMRQALGSQMVVAFVGVHNAGKSTAIHKLFGVNTNPNPLVRTETVGAYTLPSIDDPAEADDEASEDSGRKRTLRVDVLDLPGSTDERSYIATMPEKLSAAASLFVVMFTAGHIAKPEKQILDMVKKTQKNFVVLINKRETVPGLMTHADDFRRDYATRLEISEHLIYLTSLADDRNVDQLRFILFSHLSPFTDKERLGSLALKLMPPETIERLRGHKAHSVARMRDTAVQILENQTPCTFESFSSQLDDAVSMLPRPKNLPSQRASQLSSFLSTTLLENHMDRELIEMVMNTVNEQDYEHRSLVRQSALEDPDAEKPAHLQFQHMLDDWQFLLSLQARDPMEQLLDMILLIQLRQRAIFILEACQNRARALEEVVGETQRPRVLHVLSQWLMARSVVSDEDLIALIFEEQAQAQPITVVATTAAAPSQPRTMLSQLESLNLLRVSCMFRVCDRLHFRPDTFQNEISEVMPLQTRYDIFLKYMMAIFEMQPQDVLTGRNFAVIRARSDNIGTFVRAMAMDVSRGQLRGGRVRVDLVDSEAVDASGVMRAMVTQFAKEMVVSGPFAVTEKSHVYFRQDASDAATTSLWLRCFGRIIGLAIARPDINLPVSLPLAVYKMILGGTVSLLDLNSFQPQLVQSVNSLIFYDNDTLSEAALTFSVTDAKNPKIELPLSEGGNTKPVTGANVMSFVKLKFKHHLGEGLPLQEMVMGVQDVVPAELLAAFTPADLQLLVQGNPHISLEELWAHRNIMHERHPDQQSIEWLYQCLQDFDQSLLSRFLVFVTGNATPPFNGFGALSPPFTVIAMPRQDALLVSHTCFNILELPKFSSLEICRDRLLTSIQNVGAADFGMS